MQHSNFILGISCSSWLSIRGLFLLALLRSLLLLFMLFTHLNLKIKPRSQLLSKDTLIYSEVGIDLLQIQGDCLTSLKKICIEIALLEGSHESLRGLIGSEGFEHIVKVLKGGFLTIDSKDVDETLLDSNAIGERANLCNCVCGCARMHCEKKRFWAEVEYFDRRN